MLSCNKRMSTLLLVTSMLPAGNAGQDLISILTAHLKKRSKTQSSQSDPLLLPLPLPPLPHPHTHHLTLCGKPERFQVNGLTYVGLSSRPGLSWNDPFGSSGGLDKSAGFGPVDLKTRHATTESGFISATSVRLWLNNCGSHGSTNETFLVSQPKSVDRHTYRAPHILMHSRCTDLFLLVVI